MEPELSLVTMVEVVGGRPDAFLERTGLDELIGRYLSPAVPVHRENSTVEVVVDGRDWMLRMRELLGSVGPGDAAYICGLQLDHGMCATALRAQDQPVTDLESSPGPVDAPPAARTRLCRHGAGRQRAGNGSEAPCVLCCGWAGSPESGWGSAAALP